MNQKHIKLGTISEDFEYARCMFTEADDRSYLYSTNDYKPCSSSEPIVWKDTNLSKTESIPDVLENGDKIVTSDIAQLIMSFDPYGVEVYPAKLIIKNNAVSDRYIISVKNIINAIDFERSVINRNPIDISQPIVSRLAICPDKLKSYPLNKRMVFRVKESNTIFFDGSIVKEYVGGLLNGKYHLCQAIEFDTSEMTPIR